MYDIIGDIHGYSKSLNLLLEKLDYRKSNGYYVHPERKAIFVGDFIDRGTFVFETLEIVKSMVDNGSALAIMGNHEYNAICFHTKSNDGKNWLRMRSQKNINQHVATLEAFNDFPKLWNEYIAWFYSLPLYLDLDEFRVVHACWDEKEIAFLKDRLPDAIMDKEFLHQSAKPGTKEFKAIESCLKGHEIFLPLGLNYEDVDGVKRNKVRVKWWKPINSETYRSIALHNSMSVPDIKIPLKYLQKLICYPPEEVPVFIGHYWNSGSPSILSPNVCCVDYSIAKDEKLVAYRWNREKQLDNANFVFQECIEKER